jgi:type I restriction enzyme, S subunit
MEVREPSAKYLAKAAFKRTEVGLIPEDWDVSSIGELAITSSGTTPPRVQADRYFANGHVPWVKTLDLNNGAIRETDECVTSAALKETCLQEFPIGTVLVAMYGGYAQIGRTGILTIPAAVNQALTAVRPYAGKLNSDYLLCVLNFKVDYWRKVASSSRKDPNITGADVKAFVLPVPHIQEQQAIATALSDADALIESLEQLLAKKRQIKQGAMQELLTGKRRLPGFATRTERKVSNVGLIPEEWECKEIGCFVDLLTGFPFSSVGYAEAGVRLLRGSNVKRGRLDWAEDLIAYWPSVTPDLKKYLLKSEDIVIAMDGSLVGRSFASLSDDDVPALLLQRVARIRTEAISQAYLRTWVCSPRFTEHCDAVKTTTAIPHISPADIRSFEIAIPPTKAEQDAISSILSDMDSDISALESKLAKARAIKQGMMQELLTGRIRLV